MPKRAYPFDSYSHTSQMKYHVPDREYLSEVYEKTIRRLFEAQKSKQASPQKEASNESPDDQNLANSCNICFDSSNKIFKQKCDFCEKLTCASKCLQNCSKCSHVFCSNCITISYNDGEDASYVCYSCKS